MPTFHKHPVDTVSAEPTKPHGIRAQIAAQYDAYLSDFAPGEGGEIHLDAADSVQTVRSRLAAAAARRGLALTTFRYTGARRYVFTLDELPKAEYAEFCS